MNKGTSSRLKSLHSIFLSRISSGTWSVGETISPAKELAKEFNCSVGMVSKALAMLEHDGLVEQRKRIGTRIISAEVQPQPEAHPLQLDAFAFIHPSEQHESSWMILLGFQKAAAAAERRVVSLSTGVDFQQESEFIRRLDEFDVQAAAVLPFLVTPEDHIKFAQLIMSAKLPIMLVDHCPAGIACPAVHVDCFHAGYAVTEHLLERGNRRIGFLTNNGLRLSGRNRHQGFVWAMREHGLQPDQDLVHFESNMHPNFDDPYSEPTEIAKNYLNSVKKKKIDALVCSNDVLAIGVLRAAEQMGISVPEDLRVVGIDDLRVSSELGLTSYLPPFEMVGRSSFEMLDKLSKKEKREQDDVAIRGKLMVRKTS